MERELINFCIQQKIRGYKKRRDGFFKRDAQSWLEIFNTDLNKTPNNLHDKITLKGLRQIAYGEV